MSSIQTVALCLPLIASNAIFSVRRADRSIDSFEEKPLYSIANANIALAQVLKGGRAVKALTLTTEDLKTTSNTIRKASEVIKEASKKSELVNGTVKVIDFTAKNINPVICIAGGINVLSQDDKVDALARESCALTTMFLFENVTKKLIGMPSFTNKNQLQHNQSLLKNSKLAKTYCNMINHHGNKLTEKSFKLLKALPSVGKGLLFATASIVGYKIGVSISNKILGPKENTSKG